MQANQQRIRWHVFPRALELRDAAVEFVDRIAKDSIAHKSAFNVVLAGGETPRSVYEQLTSLRTVWRSWHVYFGDERCLPLGDPQRNSTMAGEAWLNRVDIPREQIHAIPGELGPHSAALRYCQVLLGVEDFDLVLLGLGEDGHTASLFPDRRSTDPAADATVLAVEDAPKLPSERVTLSAKRLSRARHVVFMASGVSKREAVRRWRAGEAIPASEIVPAGGVDVLIDEAALNRQVDPQGPPVA